jgi:hypothetical protein
MVRLWATYRKIPGPRPYQRSKPAVVQPVVVLSSPFSSKDKRDISVGNLERAALG